MLRVSPEGTKKLDFPLSSKILTSALLTHFSTVLDHMIRSDQSYTVPGQIIHDNIHLIREAIHYSQRTGLLSPSFSLDWENVFDRVNHEYLEKGAWDAGLIRVEDELDNSVAVGHE
eukprot:g39027.t1